MQKLRWSFLPLVLFVVGCTSAQPARVGNEPYAFADTGGEAVALREADLGELQVHFIDVGQGDCTLIECPGGRDILVDCGSLGGADRGRVRAYIAERLDDGRVETLVITHPDADHYNLIEEVLEEIEVEDIVLTGTTDEYSASNFDFWLEQRTAITRRLEQDDFDPADQEAQFLTCGPAIIRVLAADTPATQSPTNARSIVLLVSHGDVDVLLTGDATFDTEEMILSRYDHDWLRCEVLKIGHHGSSTTSTSDQWAEVISPDAAVASASYDNRFGHPRKVVIERLMPFTLNESPHPMRWGWWENRRARYENVPDFDKAIYSTATNGTIVLTSDGEYYWIDYGSRGRLDTR